LAEIVDDRGTAVLGRKFGHARHDMEVRVAELLLLREQHHVGLLASGDFAQRAGERLQERANLNDLWNV